MSQLKDHAARLLALTDFGRSYIFEAGAGSGKTSLLAGRVVGLMVRGVRPENIVSVSFTELAASELLGRIFDFASGLAEGRTPPDIAAAYPNGLTDAERETLRAAVTDIGDMTCTTIHGFCQKLLRPYPVEAGIDPGASIVDPNDATLIYQDVLDRWLRKRLSGFDPDEDIITALVAHDAAVGVPLIETVANRLRSNHDLQTASAVWSESVYAGFVHAVDAFRAWTAVNGSAPDDHVAYVEDWNGTLASVLAAAGCSPHTAVVRLSGMEAGERVTVKTGGYRAYRLKGAWKAIDKKAGERLHDEAFELYAACAAAFEQMKARAAAVGLSELRLAVWPVIAEYADYKREAALLDFDDLMYRTRSLLGDYPEVLAALRTVYTHILVDEFQDTDPVQTKIFEFLSFDEAADGTKKPIPGGIFFVGDPKQSIYRFRGADVATYVRMREQMRLNDPDSVQSIFVNFRSTSGILDYVNDVFGAPLALPRQPGFTPLDSHRGHAGVAVMKYRADDDGSVNDRRRLEAEHIAETCLTLFDTYEIARKDGTKRLCLASDIALLAPVNTNLFWLETALEERGIPVSTQAGKGLFQQQEIKDLIALTRVLADPRDTLALGALLRGSFFGFTEQAMLDVAAALPDRDSGELSFLNLSTPVHLIADRDMAAIVGRLAAMRDGAVTTTPFDALSEAITTFDIRSKTRNRGGANAARRLANIERYLEMSRSFDVRGIRAFSDTMRDKWENSERVQEGRPGGRENAVSIITIHSSKGLEWPVVFTVNCATAFNNKQTVFSDVRDSRLTMRFLKQKPEGYDEFVAECQAEDHAERVRLMYVGLTRARDLLIVPDIPHLQPVRGWSDLVDLSLDALPYFENDVRAPSLTPVPDNGVTVSKSRHEELVGLIAANRVTVRKRVPSSHEWHASFSDRIPFDDIVEAAPDLSPYANIEGGFARGNVLHKLMEEVITGELGTDAAEIEDRARELIFQVVSAAKERPPEMHAAEVAGCVARTLALPGIVSILPRLVAEVGTSSAFVNGGVETLTMGVADAIEVFADGSVGTVVDWKSDLRPTRQAIANYREQVTEYLRMNGIARGLIVFMSSGSVVEVAA